MENEKKLTRDDICLYRDQQLIDYYDNCIEVFEEYQAKEKKIQKLWNQAGTALRKSLIVSFGWLVAAVFLVLGLIGYHSYLNPQPSTIEDEEFIRCINSIKSSMRSIITEKQRETLNAMRERMKPWFEKEELWFEKAELWFENALPLFWRFIIWTASILLVILVPLFLTRRKACKLECRAQMQELDSFYAQVKKELETPAGRLADALLVFADIHKLDEVRKLRKIVADGLASSHDDAVRKLQMQM